MLEASNLVGVEEPSLVFGLRLTSVSSVFEGFSVVQFADLRKKFHKF